MVLKIGLGIRYVHRKYSYVSCLVFQLLSNDCIWGILSKNKTDECLSLGPQITDLAEILNKELGKCSARFISGEKGCLNGGEIIFNS